MTYSSIIGQASMALDETRNKIYESALKSIITPKSVVLDIGAGLGPFGLLAAKLGAKKVYLVEPQPLIHIVRNVVRNNGWENRVVCLQGKIEDVELPEKVDVITSCFTGNFLLSEDLLSSLFYARDKHLKRNGRLVPDSGTMLAVPVSIPKIYKNRIASYSKSHLGIDYSFCRQYAANNSYKQRNIKLENYITKPAHIQTIDFYNSDTASCDKTVDFNIDADKVCHGFLGWFDMTLGKEILSTSVDAPAVHWSPLWFPIDPPLTLKIGEILSLTVKKPQNKPWSWVMKNKLQKRTHSNFILNVAQQSDDFNHKRDSRRLKPQSQSLLFVLYQFSQGKSLQQIADRLCQRWPKQYKPESVNQYVEDIAHQYCE